MSILIKTELRFTFHNRIAIVTKSLIQNLEIVIFSIQNNLNGSENNRKIPKVEKGDQIIILISQETVKIYKYDRKYLQIKV